MNLSRGEVYDYAAAAVVTVVLAFVADIIDARFSRYGGVSIEVNWSQWLSVVGLFYLSHIAIRIIKKALTERPTL